MAGSRRGAKTRGSRKTVTKQSLAILIGVPWVVFLVIQLLWLLVYHFVPEFVWLSIIALAAAAVFCWIRPAQPEHPWMKPLGALLMGAGILSTLIGTINYGNSVQEYFGFESRQIYSNVLASEPAAAHGDAGLLVFSQTARVDTTKAVGFKNAGHVYCAAPVLDATQMARVEYWAVGMDCCGARSSFTCGSANDVFARGGIVQKDANSWLSHFAGLTENQGYFKAVKLAEASHGLASSEHPILVKWVTDAIQSRNDLWSSALAVALVSSSIYLFLSILAGVASNAIARSFGKPDREESAVPEEAEANRLLSA